MIVTINTSQSVFQLCWRGLPSKFHCLFNHPHHHTFSLFDFTF